MLGTDRHFVIQALAATAVGLCLAAPSPVSAQAEQGLSEAEFRKLHKQLQPPRDELWRTIPWQMSILEARALAAREKKPLVMRVRSGHPLGCV
jgi:hypothetical protein